MRTAVLVNDADTRLIGYRRCCATHRRYFSYLSDQAGAYEARLHAKGTAARQAFTAGLADSLNQGWRLIYRGQPNRG